MAILGLLVVASPMAQGKRTARVLQGGSGHRRLELAFALQSKPMSANKG